MPQIPPVCTGPDLPFDLESDPDKTLYVPIGAGTAYQTAWGWSDFKNIVETDFAFLLGKDEMDADQCNGNIEITATDGCIEITSPELRQGSYIISTVDGRTIATGDLQQRQTMISVPQGLYVVNAANTTRKVAVY